MGQLEIQPESSLYVLPMVRMWTASNGVRLLNRPLIRTSALISVDLTMPLFHIDRSPLGNIPPKNNTTA